MPLLHPAPAWTPDLSRYVTLWHGCTSLDQANIQATGIDLARGRLALDFGRGFYTTSLKRQARHWAWLRYYDPKSPKGGNQPVVIRFRMDRHRLAALKPLCFVRGHYDHLDYWSLVPHCRQSVEPKPKRGIVGIAHDHKGPVSDDGDWYDVVAGPAAASWTQRVAMTDADQYSFHTSAAVKLLNDLITSGSPDDYRWEAVVP